MNCNRTIVKMKLTNASEYLATYIWLRSLSSYHTRKFEILERIVFWSRYNDDMMSLSIEGCCMYIKLIYVVTIIFLCVFCDRKIANHFNNRNKNWSFWQSCRMFLRTLKDCQIWQLNHPAFHRVVGRIRSCYVAQFWFHQARSALSS